MNWSNAVPSAAIVRGSKLVALLAGLALGALVRADQPPVESAKEFFAQYTALEQAYDPSVAELYADAAFIRTKRKPPMGEAVEVIIPVAEYRTLLRQHMAVAQARGDRSAYVDVTYTPEGAFVRIDASRQVEARSKTSAVSMLVGRSAGGKWLIYEESSAAPPWER